MKVFSCSVYECHARKCFIFVLFLVALAIEMSSAELVITVQLYSYCTVLHCSISIEMDLFQEGKKHKALGSKHCNLTLQYSPKLQYFLYYHGEEHFGTITGTKLLYQVTMLKYSILELWNKNYIENIKSTINIKLNKDSLKSVKR